LFDLLECWKKIMKIQSHERSGRWLEQAREARRTFRYRLDFSDLPPFFVRKTGALDEDGRFGSDSVFTDFDFVGAEPHASRGAPSVCQIKIVLHSMRVRMIPSWQGTLLV
jgi:hypothetical protein